MRRIGIDVGGTNTDAVYMDGDRVVAGVKSATTADVTGGIVAALAELRRACPVEPGDVQAVMIGTTHFINALVQARGLAPTAAIRIGLPATAMLPPYVDWPSTLTGALGGHAYMCRGGHEFDGRPIVPLDEPGLRAAVEQIAASGVRSVAISSVFAPVNAEFELRAAELVTETIPDARISMSHRLGRMGLLGRENATIFNAALQDLAENIVSGLTKSLREQGFLAPIYLSQNDGTLMDVDFARTHPVLTIASGPTNSMRGAAFLSGLRTCAVIDVGGTTTDIGILQDGFPREAAHEVVVAGVRTSFRMPDVPSAGIGGGSLVRTASRQVTVGPDSVGYELTSRALVFGGDTLTATDIAVAAGLTDIGDRSAVAQLDASLIAAAREAIAAGIGDLLDRVRTSAAPVPAVAVGGGSILVPDTLEGASRLERPENFAVANAVGAAIAQVGGEVDRVFTVGAGGRDAVVDQAKQEAVDKAVAAGAAPGSVEIVDVDEVPLAYLPGNATRVRVKAVGDLTVAAPSVAGPCVGGSDA